MAYGCYLIGFSCLLGANILTLRNRSAQITSILFGEISQDELIREFSPFTIKLKWYILRTEKSRGICIFLHFFTKIAKNGHCSSFTERMVCKTFNWNDLYKMQISWRCPSYGTTWQACFSYRGLLCLRGKLFVASYLDLLPP